MAVGTASEAANVAVATVAMTTADDVSVAADTRPRKEPMSEVTEGSTNVTTLTSADRIGAPKTAAPPNPVAGKAASAPATIHAFDGKRPGAIIPGFLAAEASKPGGAPGKPDTSG